ncbi:MAG: VWA domain-containing protein, partial [Gammaproteobacteria bacterium]
LVAAAAALGLDSLRPPLAALRAARAAAALEGATRLDEAHLALAVRLVLLPRARQLPATAAEAPPTPAVEPAPDPGTAPPPDGADDGADSSDATAPSADADTVLAAAAAALPPGLLAQIAQLGAAAGGGRRAGRAAGRARTPSRGRPIGSRPGQPGAGVRLDLVATLRAAAPWQRLRTRGTAVPGRVAVRQADFRVTRYKARTEMTTVFVVDASGSSAAHRLGEAKGAVELLLGECYVRRDRVALVAFRGAGADVLLPPTRSLVRARRALSRLPAGGGTPLASGLECALALADGIVREGRRAQLVVLTDGRPNVGRDGRGGAADAMRDALAVAAQIRLAEHAVLLIDVAPRPRPFTAECATRMGATLLALPHADAATLAAAASFGSQPRAVPA